MQFHFLDIDNLGGPFYAFPSNQPTFELWNSLRVAGVESLGKFVFDVDINVSTRWHVFRGETEPVGYSQAVAVKDFNLELKRFYTGPR